MKHQLKILKMHCASCAANIEMMLNRTPGVSRASLNYANEKLQIEFDQSQISIDKIKKIIVDLGYDYQEISAQNKYDSATLFKWRFWISFAIGIPVIYLAMGGMLNLQMQNLDARQTAFWEMLLASVVIIANFGIWTSGAKSLWRLRPNMDALIFIGTISAFIFSLYQQFVRPESMTLYYESAVFILIFIALGKYLEAKSKRRAGQAIEKLIGLQPNEATVLDKDQHENIKPIADIKIGEHILAKPGEKIALDGQVIEGYSSTDEKMLTGESIPIEKSIGSQVFAGTINQSGRLVYRVTSNSEQTMLSQIVKTVDQALSQKPDIQLLADKLALYFVPTVITIATLSLVAWLLLGHSDIALRSFVSVLIIACPCALGLATPTAVMMGTGLAAEKGILIRDLRALQAAAKIKYMAFDKTGTITEGKPRVKEIYPADETLILAYASSLEKSSEHPLATAIIKEGEKQNVKTLPVDDFEAIPGQGVIGNIEGKRTQLGNILMLQQEKVSLKNNIIKKAKELEQQGNTIVYLATNNKLIGLIAVADTVKPEAKKVLTEIKKMNITPVMLSGDNRRVAEAVANEVGIADEFVFAETLPVHKALAIKALQNNDLSALQDKNWNKLEEATTASSHSLVAMVGDGINDSPALAQSDLGIAIGSGSDIALETGDIVLVRNTLTQVPQAIDISKYTLNKIKQNLFWAFIYNVIGIPIAAGALYSWTGLTLNPAIAALAMAFSSLSVVGNSIMMKRR